jgi:quercetin dioxygenase-like cupin family protein
MKLLAITAFAAAAAFTTTNALGGQPPVMATPLAFATLHQPYAIKVSGPGDVLVVKVRVAPGGTFGWHSHRSAVAVAVMAGTLTLYDKSVSDCAPQTFSRGTGFVEPPNHVHLARNEGHTPVVLYATYLGSPHGANPNVPASRPTDCPA